MLEEYSQALDALGSSRRSLETGVTEYRRNPNDPEIERGIKGLLGDLYLFLACAVLQKHGTRKDMLSAFEPFGFKLAPMPIARRNQDLVIVGLTVMTSAVFVLTFAAFGVGRLFGGGYWQPSVDFPTKSYDPFTWAASAAFVHGTAILVADRLRRRLMSDGRWLQSSADGRCAIPANYVRIAIACGIAGYISMCLLGAMMYGPSIPLLTGAAPYLLMPAVTGAFYVYHLDNAELDTRPGRLQEIALQAAFTGFCGLVAAPVWLSLGRGVGDALDFIAFSGVTGATVGATLAWYIPEAAKRRLVTPLVVARRDRLIAIEVAARERFGNAASADQWLRQPIPSLGNISPIDAAADIDQYDNVIDLLRRPANIAA
jgi:hypothetical protein